MTVPSLAITEVPAATAGPVPVQVTAGGAPAPEIAGQCLQGDVVLVHGFTQTGLSWIPAVTEAQAAAKGFRFLLPDAPGHGRSVHVDAGLWEVADLLAELVPGKAFFGGYSMGGRMAMHTAIAHPDKVRGLILVSTSAGIDDPGERKARAISDEALASKIGAEGVGPFLREWLAQPLFKTLKPSDAGISDRLANSAGGLAASLRKAGVGSQEPLWERLGQLRERRLPALVIAGSLDAKYTLLARRLAEAIGATAQIEVVSGAGHACHLERPAVAGRAIGEFIRSC